MKWFLATLVLAQLPLIFVANPACALSQRLLALGCSVGQDVIYGSLWFLSHRK